MGRRIAGAYVSSVISISLVLLLTGVASILLLNAGQVEAYFRENAHLTAILKPGTTESRALQYKSQLDSRPFVLRSAYISAEEGRKEMADLLGEDFLSAFADTPIPVSIEVTLRPEWTDRLDEVSAQIAADAVVDEVDCRKTLIDSMRANLARVSVFIGSLVLLLLFVSVVLISNVVRLTIHSKRFDIYTMRLVGASRSYIIRPYLVAAFLQGTISSVLASGLLAGLMLAVKNSLGSVFELFSWPLLGQSFAIIFAAGLTICETSTFFVVRRLVTMSKDELYG